MTKNKEKIADPGKDKLVMNILITFLALPVILLGIGILFMVFGTSELFSKLGESKTGVDNWPISTPYLILLTIGVPVAALGIILFKKK